MPEGEKYQYVCRRTDIQAARMCGFKQAEGKCGLLSNDVSGIDSSGESLRQALSGFGGKQLSVMICGVGALPLDKTLPLTFGVSVGKTVMAFIAASAICIFSGIHSAWCHLFLNPDATKAAAYDTGYN